MASVNWSSLLCVCFVFSCSPFDYGMMGHDGTRWDMNGYMNWILKNMNTNYECPCKGDEQNSKNNKSLAQMLWFDMAMAHYLCVCVFVWMVAQFFRLNFTLYIRYHRHLGFVEKIYVPHAMCANNFFFFFLFFLVICDEWWGYKFIQKASFTYLEHFERNVHIISWWLFGWLLLSCIIVSSNILCGQIRE